MPSAVAGTLLRVTRGSLRLDGTSAVIVAIGLLCLAVLVPRSTGDALKLAAFVNDEPALTMALDAMTKRPYGNPANLYDKTPTDPTGPGPEWGFIRYSGFNYYGGLYLGLGFSAFAPLKAIGLPLFPTAPIILRIISLAAAILSLIVLYNFGKRYAGPLVGAGAALFLLSEPDFFYYASIIHPDTLQLLLGLLGVAFAIHHAARGDIATLLALAVVAGLSQGTKLGAIWFVPTMLLAVHYGLRSDFPRPWRSVLLDYAGRVLLLGAVSVAFWFLSTPYAVLGKYYFATNFATFGVVSADSLNAGGLLNLLATFHSKFGVALYALIIAGVLWCLARLAVGRLPRPLVLMLVTALMQILWFGLINRFWVITGYCMVAYSLLAVLSGIMLTDLVRALRSRAPAAASMLAAGLVLLFALQLAPRLTGLANYSMTQLLRDHSTAVAADRWFKAQAVPSTAAIVWDDVAYLDPKVFPKARMHGGLLRWSDLRAWDYDYPDYIILSASIYDSSWWAGEIAKQQRDRNDGFNLSIRLYQDLLGRPDPARNVPWIEHLHTISPQSTSAPSVILFGWPEPFESWLGPWTTQPLRIAINGVLRAKWLSGYFGANDGIVSGPELRIFRVNPQGSACPRERAFSDAGGDAGKPLRAFDGTPAYWTADGKGAALEGKYLAVDFGCRTQMGGREIRINWLDPVSTPAAIRIEASEDGQSWREVAALRPKYGAADLGARTDTIQIDPAVRARYWKFIADSVPDGRGFAVQDIIIPE